MKKGIQLNRTTLEHAILGGTILGGGGGGCPTKGNEFASIAVNYTDLRLVDIQDIEEDALLLTVSLVGAPNAENKFLYAKDFATTIDLFQKNCNAKLGGIITNENGGEATVNGWLQSALTGLPLVDAPCNGRAHPTGVMGSLNLHKKPLYSTIQTFAGGNPATGAYVEGVVKGTIEHTSKLVRLASVEADGLVAVARNPVPVSYVKEHGAVGGISHAIEVGNVYAKGLETSPETALDDLCTLLNGRVLARGIVEDFSIEFQGGFDVGRAMIDGVELTFWNEYMTAERGDQRLATFPQLIMSFDAKTGTPLTTAMMANDLDVVVFACGMDTLKLSSTMYDPALIATCEPIIGKELNKYHTY